MPEAYPLANSSSVPIRGIGPPLVLSRLARSGRISHPDTPSKNCTYVLPGPTWSILTKVVRRDRANPLPRLAVGLASGGKAFGHDHFLVVPYSADPLGPANSMLHTLKQFQ